ncbi:MAG: endonuclease [Candidatus Diapherotrites archaeon]|nr:endonuclease [Candidatus Diapherotrites archaeon]
MAVADVFFIVLLAALFALALTVFFLLRQNQLLKHRLEEVLFKKTSQSVKYGKLTEQFIPFTKEFPFDSANFRFIGEPIDGLAFEDGKIFFCEFKASDSMLSTKQQKIKKLVEEKKVEWFEFRLR